MPENIGKKRLGRWPVVFADYQDALDGKIKPVPKEVFLDYQGKDAYFYDPAGFYVSIISLIRAGLIDTWMPPCVSYEAILTTYPDAPLGSVCVAVDTGIMYEYVGNGKWVPASINGLPLASYDVDGLMSAKEYAKLQDCYNRTKIILLDYNQQAPLPKNREPNALYEITTGMIAELHEKDFQELIPVDEKVIKPDWAYEQLWDVDLDSGQLYEINDPLYLAVRSADQVKPVEVPEGYSDVLYLVPSNLIETLNEVQLTYKAYPEDWPYDKTIDTDADGKTYSVTDPGYKTVSSDSEVVEVEPEAGVSTVYYNILKDADTVRDEGLQQVSREIEIENI